MQGQINYHSPLHRAVMEEKYMEIFEIFKGTLGTVRTMYIPEDDSIWFFGNDVAKALGYVRTNEAITDHTSLDDRKALKFKAYAKTPQADLWGKNDFMDKIFINESGLYCMIFGSKLEAAVKFKLWVTKEVLPSIRKNGGYILGQEKLNKEEKELLESRIKALKKEMDALNGYATDWENMYFKLLKEYSVYLQKEAKVAEEVPEIKSDEYIRTKEGYVMRRTLWEELNK